MAATFYFYDLETSGINSRRSRVMQFAGQRTDLKLKPIGEPDNILIKLTEDILPDPDAILITGITPQKTRADGISEADFLKYFHSHVSQPETIFVGFNNVRFDDEFMRFMNYRNYYDAYEWTWKDGRSRWDLLDVIRMTRALRPDGIKWSFDSNGKASNRLEFLTSVNKLKHDGAHDALSDVTATIAVARLIYNKQPKLFDYLLSMRDKKAVAKIANAAEPFVYSSGKYPSLYHKTTVVQSLGSHPGKQGVLVYDLRSDPELLRALSPVQLASAWMLRNEDETKRFPVKTLQFNRCPAVAPINVLDKASQERIKIDLGVVQKNRKSLVKQKDLFDRLIEALKLLDRQQQRGLIPSEQEVDNQLYDGFFDDSDRTAMSVVRAAEADEIGSLEMEFKDQRLSQLLPLYKARNFPSSLTSEERASWETYRFHKLMDDGEKSQANLYFTRLGELANRTGLKSEEQFLLEELQMYGESILPEPIDS
jgi:exodeoxyribonuclease-1